MSEVIGFSQMLVSLPKLRLMRYEGGILNCLTLVNAS